MKIKKELIKRDIAGDVVLVPVGKSVIDSNGLYILNELGSFIWDILGDCNDIDDIVLRVLDEYDIDRETALTDINAFINKLKEMDIIE